MPKINRNSEGYQKIFNRINRTVVYLPSRIATLAVNFSKERFVQKNWLDTIPRPWPVTKKRKGSTLVASGRLKRSIRKVSVTPSRVIIGTDVPSARAHNEGMEIKGTETVRTHSRRQHARKAYTRKAYTVAAHTRKAYTRKGKRVKPHDVAAYSVAAKRIKRQTVKEHQVKQFSRKYHRKFAKRQFIGQSYNLNERVRTLIDNELQKAIKV